MEIGQECTRRALTWMGVATLGMLVAGVVYLRPSLAPPAAATPAAFRSCGSAQEHLEAGLRPGTFRHGPVTSLDNLSMRQIELEHD